MTTIDQRIVDMQFNNQQFESGVQTSLKSLENLKKGLNLDASAKSLSNLEAAGKAFTLDGIASAVKEVSDKFSSFGIIGITVLNNLTNQAFNAGKRITAALTIDPVNMGFREYETQLNAVQTILANTSSKGTDLKQVNAALDQLNTYADKTIYNFTEMTKNIGTFTAAGIDLDTSVEAIKGIANLAAVSGSNSQQASTAMYQLSQALSSGTVRLMDWNSVVNAGMGGEVFKNALMETARVHGVNVDAIIKKEGSFRESLASGWLSSEILTKTLAKFTGDLSAEQLKQQGYTEKQIEEIIKLGQTANDAATKVKTFTQLMDTLKEAAQSGWAQSWRIIVGDFEEAKELLTEMSDIFGGMIGASAEVRNAMLQSWKDLGGRTALIDALRNVLNIVLDLIRPISDAFKDIFPPTTGEQLFALTEGFKKLTENLKVSEEFAEKIRKIFKGLFSVIKIGVTIVSAFVKVAFELAKVFIPIAGALVDIAAGIGVFVTYVKDAVVSSDILNTSMTNITHTLSLVRDFFDRMISSAKLGLPIFTVFTSAIGKAFKFLSDKFKELFTTSNIDMGANVLNGGLFAAILFGVKKFIDSLTGFVDSGSGLVGSIKSIFGGLTESVNAMTTSIKSKTLLTIATAIGILAAALLVLSLIDPAKMSVALAGMTVLFTELFGSMLIFEKIAGGKGFKSMKKITVAMVALSVAILLLSAAVKMLAELNYEQLAVGLAGVGTLLLELAVFMKISDFSKKAKFGGLILLAGAIYILALAIGKFAELSVKQLIKGLGAMGVVLTELSLFMKFTGDAKHVLATATAITILAAGMLILSKALENLGNMSAKQIIKSLIALGGALGVITAAMHFMPTNMVGSSAGLVLVATAMLILAEALKNMGEMTKKEIIKGLIALGGALTIIVVAMNAMTAGLAGAAALLVISSSLLVLAGVLKILGGMTVKEILKSLGTMALMFGVIGLATLALAPIIPVLYALAGAMALLGIASLAIGVGLLAFSTALTALAVSGVAAASAIVIIITSLIELIPLIWTKMAEGIIRFATVIRDGAPIIVEALKAVALAMITMITEIIPDVVFAVVTFLLRVLEELAIAVPKMVDAGMRLILGILKGIADNIRAVTEAGIEVIIQFLKGVEAKLPDIIDTAFKVIISFINGLADAITNNQVQIRSAVWKLITSIVGAFTGFIGDIVKLGKDSIDGIIKGLKDSAGKLWTETVNVGKNMMEGFVSGVTSMAGRLADAAWNAVKGAVDGVKNFLGIRSPSKLMASFGEHFDQGFINGMMSLADKVASSATDVGKSAVDGMSLAMAKINDVLNDDTDFNPTITPVIDMTQIEKGLRTIDRGFSQNRGISLEGTSRNANSLSAEMANRGVALSGDGFSTKAPVQNYVFNQNNYSPKALSRLDIYRQTKNQFSALKGLVEST